VTGAIALLPPLPAASPADTQTPEQRTPKVRSNGSTDSGGSPAEGRAAGRSPQAPARAEVPGLLKYLRMERKQLLIWPDQITQCRSSPAYLTGTAGGAGERITTNTLIRVAAALLLSRSQDLAGTTEEELRRSLGLPPAAENVLTTTPPAPPRSPLTG
jgi:hypothetical protein